MTDLRARLAEVLAKLAGEEFDRDTGEYLAISLCQDPALARALEDAERYRWLRDTADDAWEVRRWIDSDTQELHYGENMDTAIDAARQKP